MANINDVIANALGSHVISDEISSIVEGEIANLKMHCADIDLTSLFKDEDGNDLDINTVSENPVVQRALFKLLQLVYNEICEQVNLEDDDVEEFLR